MITTRSDKNVSSTGLSVLSDAFIVLCENRMATPYYSKSTVVSEPEKRGLNGAFAYIPPENPPKKNNKPEPLTSRV